MVLQEIVDIKALRSDEVNVADLRTIRCYDSTMQSVMTLSSQFLGTRDFGTPDAMGPTKNSGRVQAVLDSSVSKWNLQD